MFRAHAQLSGVPGFRSAGKFRTDVTAWAWARSRCHYALRIHCPDSRSREIEALTFRKKDLMSVMGIFQHLSDTTVANPRRAALYEGVHHSARQRVNAFSAFVGSVFHREARPVWLIFQPLRLPFLHHEIPRRTRCTRRGYAQKVRCPRVA